MSKTKSELSRAFSSVADAIIASGAYRATKFLSPRLTVKATRRHRVNRRDRRVELLFTYGQPNHEERSFVSRCRRAGEPLPVKKVQLKFKAARRA